MPLMKDNAYLEEVDPRSVRLLGERVVARVICKPRYAGRFFVPKQFEQRTMLARVENVGEGYEGPVKVGDVVIYRNWSGREWQSPDERLILLTPEDIEAIVEADES